MKTFIFDVDDTLYDQTQPFDKAFNKFLKGKYDLDAQELYKRTRVYGDAIFPKVETGEVSVDESGVYRMVHAMQDYGITYSQEEALAFQLAYRYHQGHLEMSNEMKQLLEELKGKVTLGVLTNGVSEHQHSKIQGLGLTTWIPKENLFVSGDLGMSKPNLKVFDYIENKLKNKKEETYFVGDSIMHDIVGAKRAGWKMIWLNRRNHNLSSCEFKPDFIAKSEAELISIIKTLIDE